MRNSLWISGGVVTLLLAAFFFWRSRLPGEADIFQKMSRFPYPNVMFLRNPGVWLELGLTSDQARFIVDPKPLARSSGELARFGREPNGFTDQILRLERVEAQLDGAQRKRYFELRLQQADTLALRDPRISNQLSLSKLQQQQVDAAQQSFDEARRIRRDQNESLRLESNKIYRENGVTGRLTQEIADAPRIPNWIDYSEKIYVRSLLTSGQLTKLESLKGAGGVVGVADAYGETFAFTTNLIEVILNDSDFLKRLHVGEEIVEVAKSESRPDLGSPVRKDWYQKMMLLNIWPKLNAVQKNAIVIEEIRRSRSVRVALRMDVAKILGMSNEERDRLGLRSMMHATWGSIEYKAMSARRNRLEPDSYGLRSDKLTLRWYGEPQFNTVQDHDVVLWAGMSTPVRKKWLELGGKEPKFRPFGR
jgi:hypothetical protein